MVAPGWFAAPHDPRATHRSVLWTPFGRYDLIELLGREGMGEVWKAFDTVTQRVVAVKVLPASECHQSGVQPRWGSSAVSPLGRPFNPRRGRARHGCAREVR
jgi:serine/threonine protein kinase